MGASRIVADFVDRVDCSRDLERDNPDLESMSNHHHAHEALQTINEAWIKGWPKVVAKAWVDDAFRARLLANPAEVLAEEGLPLLPHVDLKIVPGSASAKPAMVITLPEAPADLGEESIEGLLQSGARAENCMGTSCCC
jgi:hypothetical protein